jgi:hypothetical protein
MQNVLSLLIGIYFGIVLIKSEVSSWFRIQNMFRFEEPHMYLVMCSAVVVGAISIQLIKMTGQKTLFGDPVDLKDKPYQKGTIIGGALFGVGWAITGACPGPIYAQLGSGEYLALVSFAGAFLGAYLYAWVKPRLPH